MGQRQDHGASSSGTLQENITMGVCHQLTAISQTQPIWLLSATQQELTAQVPSGLFNEKNKKCFYFTAAFCF